MAPSAGVSVAALPSEGSEEAKVSSFTRDDYHAQTQPLMTLIDAANVTQRALDKRLTPLRLGVSWAQILHWLYSAKEPLTPSTLAALLLLETHSVSGALNRLESRGLITRGRTRKDRRTVLVSLTPAGREAAEDSKKVVEGTLRELASEFDGPNAAEALDAVTQALHIGFKVAGRTDGEAPGGAEARLGLRDSNAFPATNPQLRRERR